MKICVALLCVFTVLIMGACSTHKPVYRPVAVDDFAQNLSVWRKARPGTTAKNLQRAQIIEAAENMLLMQRADGGWPTGTHPLRELSPAERETFINNKQATDSSFAHHNIFPQIYYLSHVYLQTGDVRYRDAARRGVERVMDSQFYNGGWPVRPADSDGTRIDMRTTLNALVFLRKIAAGKMPYGYIPFDARRNAADAVRKGDEWLLRVQQAYDSRASIWSPVYGLESSAPIIDDKLGVAALDVALSVDIMRYLMVIERPPVSVRRAVIGAADWFGRYSLQQWQANQPATKKTEVLAYSHMPLPGELQWARYYDPVQNVPLVNASSPQQLQSALWFNRQYINSEFGAWPRDLLLEQYPAWRIKNNL